ncbi:hypothetical protein ACFJIV_26825 [Mucilaginibacter sp. UC70_90]
MTLLNDDWAIEERCQEAFIHWQLTDIDLSQKMARLAAGKKRKYF